MLKTCWIPPKTEEKVMSAVKVWLTITSSVSNLSYVVVTCEIK